jgi:hypothetical protein
MFFVALAPLVCAHVFRLCHDALRTRVTQLRTQITKDLRSRRCIRIILLIHLRDLTRPPAKVHTSLTPHRTLEDREPDIVAYPNPVPEMTSCLAGMHGSFDPSLLLETVDSASQRELDLRDGLQRTVHFLHVNLLCHSLYFNLRPI